MSILALIQMFFVYFFSGEGSSGESALTFTGRLTCHVTPAVNENSSLFEEEAADEPIAKRRK